MHTTLITNGIRRGDIVGLSLERSIYLPIAILGISKVERFSQPPRPGLSAWINYILQDGGQNAHHFA